MAIEWKIKWKNDYRGQIAHVGQVQIRRGEYARPWRDRRFWCDVVLPTGESSDYGEPIETALGIAYGPTLELATLDAVTEAIGWLELYAGKLVKVRDEIKATEGT